MRSSLYCLLLLLFGRMISLSAQDTAAIKANYDTAFMVIKKLVENNDPKGFKKAVFITEYAYTDRVLDYHKFDDYVYHLSFLCRQWMVYNPLQGYHYPDSTDFHTNFAVFRILKDTLRIIAGGRPEVANYPYTYDFEDFFAHRDWSNMFVSKLLVTHKGNCHSLPYLYKILADEMDARCWLALAPNHLYIKNRCKKAGWYNTELTSGSFPIDAWITASGYIPLQAIQNGIYMDTLSNRQTIALCMLDLAKGYERRIKDYTDGFILRCCDYVLTQHPQNVQALLLKAETMKRIYGKQVAYNDPAASETYGGMSALYAKLLEFGYREMPESMYMEWLQSVYKERGKFSNKNIDKE